MAFTRRRFLKGMAGLSGAALFAPARRTTATPRRARRKLPRPEDCGIEHIVVVMMENRSFDHLFGWHPNADGIQKGLTFLDSDGRERATFALAPDYTGCGHPDPDHSYEGGRIELNGGRMDGFLRSGKNDEYSIGYYEESDRPFYSALARSYSTLDRYFCSILGPTFPNRFFMHAAQTDRLSNTGDIATMRTIWDNLAAAGISGLYYYSNLPFLILWGKTTYSDIFRTYDQFREDAKQGRLPAVSFLDPAYTFGNVPGNDDHPHADIRRGDAFLSQAFHAVATGPDWASTVFVVNYDEWGGFYEHVAPPRAAAPNDVDRDLVDGRALLGFRVPAVVASPFSAGDPLDPSVNSTVFDHTSVLKLIEWRFNLPTLTARDASDDVGNLVDVLDFDNPRAEVPDLPLYEGPPPIPCSPSVGESEDHWTRLARSGLLDEWGAPFASK